MLYTENRVQIDSLCQGSFCKDKVNAQFMHGTAELGQVDGLAGNQLIYSEFPGFWGAEDGMIVGIDCLWDAKVHTALTHSFQIPVKAFILGKEQSDHVAGSIINGAVQSVFGLVAKPFVWRSVNLDQLSGMWLTFPAMGAVTDFFLFGAFKTSIF